MDIDDRDKTIDHLKASVKVHRNMVHTQEELTGQEKKRADEAETALATSIVEKDQTNEQTRQNLLRLETKHRIKLQTQKEKADSAFDQLKEQFEAKEQQLEEATSALDRVKAELQVKELQRKKAISDLDILKEKSLEKDSQFKRQAGNDKSIIQSLQQELQDSHIQNAALRKQVFDANAKANQMAQDRINLCKKMMNEAAEPSTGKRRASGDGSLGEDGSVEARRVRENFSSGHT